MSFQPLDSRLGNDFHASQAGTGHVGEIAQKRNSGRSRASFLLALLVTVVTLCLWAVQASGQEEGEAADAGYDSIPMNENLANDSKGTLEKAVISETYSTDEHFSQLGRPWQETDKSKKSIKRSSLRKRNL